MGEDLEQLAQVCEMQFAVTEQKLRDIMALEAQLRERIRNIRNQAIISNENNALKSVGADIAWQTWVSKTLTQLNVDLAQVLAVKEGYLIEARRAFSKKLASNALVKKRSEAKRKAKLESQLRQSIEYSKPRK